MFEMSDFENVAKKQLCQCHHVPECVLSMSLAHSVLDALDIVLRPFIPKNAISFNLLPLLHI